MLTSIQTMTKEPRQVTDALLPIVSTKAKLPGGQPTSQEQAGADGQSAYQLAQLEYTKHYQGKDLSDHQLLLALDRKLKRWQQEHVPHAWQVQYINGWHEAVLADHERRETIRQAREISAHTQTFGTLCKFLRERSHVTQAEVADEFPANCDLNRRIYGKIELRTRAPRFRDLATLYKSLVRAGVEIHADERAAYLLLARQQIEGKTRYRDQVTPRAWEALTCELAKFDDSVAVLLPPLEKAPVEAPTTQQPQWDLEPLLAHVAKAATELGAALSQLGVLRQ